PRRPIRADAAESDRKRANIVRKLLRRDLIEASIRVEPASHGLLAVGKLDVLDIAGENIISPRQRSARLVNFHHAELPVSKDGVDGRGHFASKVAAAAVWNLPQPGDRKYIGPVHARYGSIWNRVLAVEKLRRLHVFGVSVSH